MTATQERTAQPRRTAPGRPVRDLRAARRTMLALVAAFLGVIPLKGLFSDTLWLLDVLVSMLIVMGPAVLLRLRRPPGALDVWPGIVLLVPWLTVRFVPEHAYLGVIPTRGTWHDVSALMTQLHDTSQNEVAPIHTTVAVRLVVCALLGLLVALVDLIAVVGRRGALAGVPLLVVYTIAGAVPRKAVEWPWFAFAAAGFLILLALDAGDDLDSWGRRVRAVGGVRGRGVLAVSTQRIAATAILVAVAVPFVVPDQSRNLIADLFHGSSGDGIGGFGGDGTGGISPFANLKGQLDRPDPITLATVQLTGREPINPYNLRLNVLSKYTDDGWQVEGHGDRESIDATSFPTQPDDNRNSVTAIQAQISIKALRSNAPVFTVPKRVDGLTSDMSWSPQDQLVLGGKTTGDTNYTVYFDEVRPSVSDLEAAPDAAGLDRYLQGGDSVPQYVKDLVARLIKGKTNAYAKARAITDYFGDPANGFIYSLSTAPGDSGSKLVDFLKNKEGFCQQYAAATGVMMRVAGIPTRIVLGYMHQDPDENNRFSVTTSDAHAWVEAYFTGLGWIPFDTTPVTGLSSGPQSDLSWAPHEAYKSGASSGPRTPTTSEVPNPGKSQATTSSAGPSTAQADSSSSMSLVPWIVALVVLALLALLSVPAVIRCRRRRRRYAAIRLSADADALWAELSDTAVDLGYVWSPARSPRQVAAWLGSEAAGSEQPLRDIALAVERRRYSPTASGAASAADGERLVGDLQSVREALRERQPGRGRWRAVLLPPSLGWGRRARRRR